MLVAKRSRADQVSSNARTTMSFSFAFTSYSFQKYSWRPWTHSKYETTTPPAFATTSGSTRTPRSSRISSPPGLLERGGDEDVALELDQLLVRRLLRAGQPFERPVLGLVGDRRLHVDAVLV